MKSALHRRMGVEGLSDHRVAEKPEASSFGQAPEDRTGRSYNEAAFRYFLALERKRAGRADRSMLLVLVELDPRLEAHGRFEPKLASRLFDMLWSTLRDTDCLGWYREGCVIGALLIDQAHVAATDSERTINHRIGQAIRKTLGREGAPRIQVRAYQVPPMTTRGDPWL